MYTEQLNRRKRNVIVSGTLKTDEDYQNEFIKLCEDNLPIKPMIAENSCLCREKLPVKPRLLLMRLDSEETASAIRRAAPSWRKSAGEYV
jgi:hypothetical protein